MKLASFEAIIRVLNEANVRYLVVGGTAVNAHGYIRFTKDVDLVIDLEQDNTMRTLRALGSLGYNPIIPVRIEDFSDPSIRQQWIDEKNMKVMQLYCDQHQETSIDIFVSMPFEFDKEYKMAYIDEVVKGLMVRFVQIETLISMKEEVMRPRDQDDIEHLRWILENTKNDSNKE
jgi:predicted nucleotidyltransferase